MRELWRSFMGGCVLALISAAVLVTSAEATGTLDQSQPSFGPSFFSIGNCGSASLAQTFTDGISGSLDQIDIGVWRDASNAAAPLELEVYAAPGGIPSGTALASATVATSNFVTNPVSATFIHVPLDPPVAVTAGVQYAIVLLSTNLPCFAGYWWLYVEGNPYSGGGALVRFGSDAWQSLGTAGQDFAFQTYVSPLPVSIGQCQDDGWRNFSQFKNQGDCVSFVATGGKNPPA
jgi:hypothetical protein